MLADYLCYCNEDVKIDYMRKMEEKRHLRENLLSQRLRLSKAEVKKASSQIMKTLLNYTDWDHIKNLHIYLPIEKNNEIDTWPLIKLIRSKYPRTKIYIPRRRGFALFDENTEIRVNTLGIPEPVKTSIHKKIKFDLIIVPLLGFDKRGHRIGYGGGYYDRFLASNKYEQAIGVGYDFSHENKLPTEKHDQKLDLIITEKTIVFPIS